MPSTARSATHSRRRGGVRARWAAPRRAVLLAFVALAATGCATKKDMRLLRTQLETMQARQDSLVDMLRAQNSVMMDTLRGQGSMLLRVRGDLGRQIVEIGEQLVQLQELAGQSQTRLNEIRQELDRRDRELGGISPVTPGGAAAPQAAELYQAGMSMISSAPGTARQAFQQLIQQYPQDSLAAAAQYQIGESYVAEKKPADAIREFQRVVERWPTSSRAPLSLFRAGVVAEQRGTIEEARGFFNKVVSQYPKSDEAATARERLRKLRR